MYGEGAKALNLTAKPDVSVTITGNNNDDYDDDDKNNGNKDDNNGDDDDNDDDAASSSNGSEDYMEDDGMLSKLNDTGNFITSGYHFDLFKANLRAFLRAPLQITLDDEPDPIADNSLDFNYATSFDIRLISALVEILKKYIEYFAGSKLSWWPLTDPECELSANYVRVYSMPFKSARFYDDIPRTLAESLFPNLRIARTQLLAYVPRFLCREAVFLHDTTLMCILCHALGERRKIIASHIEGWIGNNRDRASHGTTTTYAQRSSGDTATVPLHGVNQLGQQLGNVSNHATGVTGSANPATGLVNGPNTLMSGNNPVLFLSVSGNSNQSIARTIKLGTDDKTTFQTLQKEYRNLCTKWFRAKRVTGIKFYRFHSFLFKQALDIHYIDLHKDKERYPEQLDPEYEGYCYNPRPWPADTPFPRNEVWHYFNHPDDCGTSANAKNMLPVRIRGPITSRTRAFGMHLEERYSVLAILLPSCILASVILTPAGWFVEFWLDRHPNDLQSATIPANLAISALTLVINIPISLLIFRWTILGSG